MYRKNVCICVIPFVTCQIVQNLQNVMSECKHMKIIVLVYSKLYQSGDDDMICNVYFKFNIILITVY